MRILICGANGFVGRHFVGALNKAGHTVIRGVRKPTGDGEMEMDYLADTHTAT